MSSKMADDEIAVKMVILTMKNYQSWLSNQKIRCSKLFGKQANVLKTNVRYTYPAVQRKDYTPPVGTGLAPLRPIQLKKLRLTAEEDRNGREQKLVDNMPKFYATLWDSISVESQEIIRVRPGFEAADMEQDPNLLFVIIRETHLLEMAGGPEMVVYERIKRQMEFLSFTQGKNDSLGAFKVEYMDRRATLTAAGVVARAANEEALWFLMKLDQSRHGDMLNKLTNAAMRGTPWPATLDEAYLQASTWRVQAPRKGDGESESATYVIADTMRKKKAVQFVKKNLGSAETRKCFVCQKTGHLAKDCPDIKKSKKEEALVAMESLDNEDDWESDADDFGTF